MGETMNSGMTPYMFAFAFFAFVGVVCFGIWRLVEGLRSASPEIRAQTKRKGRIVVVYLVGVAALLALAEKLYTEVDLRVGDAGRFATRQDGNSNFTHQTLHFKSRSRG